MRGEGGPHVEGVPLGRSVGGEVVFRGLGHRLGAGGGAWRARTKTTRATGRSGATTKQLLF